MKVFWLTILNLLNYRAQSWLVTTQNAALHQMAATF